MAPGVDVGCQVDRDRGIGRRIVGRIRIGTTYQRIGTGQACKRVGASPAIQDIGIGIAGQHVGIVRAGQVLDARQRVTGRIAAGSGP